MDLKTNSKSIVKIIMINSKSCMQSVCCVNVEHKKMSSSFQSYTCCNLSEINVKK